MFSRFFIERPIFANVIAIVTMIIGGVALWRLPVERYPNITPPTVTVAAVYPGADAETLSNTVATPIEQEVNGVENMLYMSSNCSSNGAYSLTVTFEVGTNLDAAQVLVQNRVAIALPKLPQEVQRQGITTKKQSTNIVLAASLFSPDDRFTDLYLANYATLHVKDALSRIDGVGDVNVIGSGAYGMRIWLDPDKLKARNLTTDDVLRAIREQNVQVAAGQVGQYPSPEHQGFQYNVTTRGRLTDADQFADIIIKTKDTTTTPAPGTSGMTTRFTRVKDVGRVELGSQAYEQWCEISGKPAATLAIYQLPGANALEVADRVVKAMQELKPSFPEGLDFMIPFDTTIFVRESIHEVYKTFAEAAILVIFVIVLFLQDWRAVLIPATTVPVTIIGAFAAMALLGFSVNMVTLFGLILAIGIVVDDAIVIVENAVHHMDHDGLNAKAATIKAMDEVLGPIIGITLVLMSVFLPTLFLAGVTGKLYRQFALTIAATAFISAINAVTLKPAQSAVYLRPTPKRKLLPFRIFNNIYDRFAAGYTAVVGRLVRWSVPMMVVYVGLVVLSGWWFFKLPTGFFPQEDQGYVMTHIQLPDAAAQPRTRAVVKKINGILADTPGVARWFLLGGTAIMDRSVSSNVAAIFISFTPWADRKNHPEQSMDAILAKLRQDFSHIPEAQIAIFPPPAISGLGVSGGFKMQLEDRSGVGLPELQKVLNDIHQDATNSADLANVLTTFRAQVPSIFVDVDREKAKTLGVPLDAIFSTLQTALGSTYVNDFNRFGRTFQVRVQADQAFRLEPEDIRQLQVRDEQGRMVPLGTFVKVERRLGPQLIQRYNLYPTAAISGNPKPGVSSGEALASMEKIAANRLPNSMGYEWTEMSFQEKRIGSQAIFVFALAVLMVYLVLAAQYESWLLPAAVILVVPLALLGTVVAVSSRGMDNNIYTQIGIVLIIALASKNAILIVEFARELRAKGRSIYEAAIEAASLRFRPILMTSFAFILGILPLVNASGAAAASRRSLGTAVFGGMIAATVLAVFFVPVFFVIMQTLSEWRRKPAAATTHLPAVPLKEQMGAPTALPPKLSVHVGP